MQQPFPRIVEKATMLYPVLYSNNFILSATRRAQRREISKYCENF